MHRNLMTLLKSKNGESITVRGGDRFRHMQYIFIKVKPGIVKVWQSYSWRSLNDIKKTKPAIATLTKDKIVFHLQLASNRSHWSNENKYDIWSMKGLLSLNLLYDVWYCHRKGKHLLRYDSSKEKKDILTLPYNRVTFNWHGDMISEIPKYIVKEYNQWDRDRKDANNVYARARYAQNKAEHAFKKHRDKGTLDEWDPKDAFKLKNVQVRQQAIEAVGLENVLKDCPTEVIDKDTVDGRPYELLEIELPALPRFSKRDSHMTQTKKCLYLKMTNPSTGEYHLEGVARKSDNSWDHIPEETVIGALAWRDGDDVERTGLIGIGGKKTDKWSYNNPVIIT